MKLHRTVDNCTKFIQTLLYPRRCLLCGAPGDDGMDLCRACRGELPHNPVACRLCGLPLTAYSDGICGECQQHPPPLDGAIIPFRYAPPLDHLLLGLKFGQQLPSGLLLGRLMADAIGERSGPLPDAILPVPLHTSRLRERGYNQALELALPIADRLGIELLNRQVVRVKATTAQSSLEKGARRKNIKGAFAVRGKLPDQIAILDDVVTTGSTVYELARSLRRAGVKRVEVWACARVP
ncbi:MAG: ComF family protein [Chromatiales bacterium]|nr:ComF family protein [Chromatiales bacterium]